MPDKVSTPLDIARAGSADAARPEIVSQVHGRGKLTARERIERLLDPGSAVEYGRVAARSGDGEWITEAGGVDFVGAIDGRAVIASSTDYTDHGGGYGAGRLGRLFALAYEQRLAVVLFVDGGGSRARHPRAGLGHIETSGPIGRFSFLDGVPELSGLVPVIAIVSGPSFAGHASLAGFSDLLISTPGSAIGMGGPPMVEAALGKRLTPNELAGAEMHERSGGIDLLVADEEAAIEMVRRYLSYQRPAESTRAPSVDLDELAADPHHDARRLVDALCDQDSQLELRPAFAPNLLTVLARIDGRTVGVLANQPNVAAGKLDPLAATKISRFVELCNAYGYPLISLVHSAGTVTSWQPKGAATPTWEPGVSRWHSRAIIAHQARTVPLIAVQTGPAAGLSDALMCGVSSTRGVPAMKLAWPNVELGVRDGYAVALDHNAFDDVIPPNETRSTIARLLRLLQVPERSGAKPHPIDTW